MATNALSDLAQIALGATKGAPATDTLVRAMETVRNQTGAVSALVFYSYEGQFAGCGVGDDPERYPPSALAYLQQRLVQLRLPLAFELEGDEVRYITRAATKQRRDYIAWLIPAAGSWTELLILRGSWPTSAFEPLLDFVDSAMPALTIMLERFVGVGRKQELERQLSAVSESSESLGKSAEIIGFVAAAYPVVGGFSQEQSDMLESLTVRAHEALDELRAHRSLLESQLRLQEYTARLERAVQVERQHATTDALTSLPNHRAALQTLKSAFETASEQGKPLSLLMGDIDNFKLFNDTYGHVMGDEVLKLVARLCQKTLEPVGTAFRYGGDEFLIVLPDQEKVEATRLAHRLVDQLGKAEFRTESDSLVPIRISIGVASYPEDTLSTSKLVAFADAAMYEAKKRLGKKGSVTSRADTTFGVLESLVLAVDAKDRYTKDHCDIVAEYAVKLAERMNLSEESQRALRIAGLLHDIGKLVVADEILKKPGPLSPEEYEVMKRHVRIGEVLIREVPQLKDVIQAVSCHHERFDGTGYPRALKGDGIPLLGRIIAVADSYSAMSLDRPYRKALPYDRVLGELLAGSGTQFDPEILKVFIELVVEEQLQRQQTAA
ncbi:MAG: diguanylate cyclase [Dehalococcoidia bacterium]